MWLALLLARPRCLLSEPAHQDDVIDKIGDYLQPDGGNSTFFLHVHVDNHDSLLLCVLHVLIGDISEKIPSFIFFALSIFHSFHKQYS